MPCCRRCQGEGEETYDEDGRTVTDVCYHCAGSGQIEDELDFHDRLACVANTLAYVYEAGWHGSCHARAVGGVEQEEWSTAHLPKIPQEEPPPAPVSSSESLTFELFDADDIPF